MKESIVTKEIRHRCRVDVPYGSTIWGIVTTASLKGDDWPSARVVLNWTDNCQIDTWEFMVLGEGEEIPEGYEYIGTVVHPSNPTYIAHWGVSIY